MLYTKQQLIDAYCASEEVLEVDLPGIIVTTQTKIDDRIAQLQNNKTQMETRLNNRVAQIQTKIDNIEPDAKEYMKDIALRYLADQAESQSDTDNDAVSL